jgi:hypothetical protein
MVFVNLCMHACSSIGAEYKSHLHDLLVSLLGLRLMCASTVILVKSNKIGLIKIPAHSTQLYSPETTVVIPKASHTNYLDQW